MPYLYRPEVLNLRDTALSYRPQDSNVTVKNEDDVSYSIGEASAFVVMLTKNVEAAEYEPFNFKLDKRSEEHNALAYSWDWLVWAAKQGKPVGIQPNTPQHLNAVWSDKSTKIEVEPSVILDTGHHIWLLNGVESGPDSSDRLRRLAPGFDILGSVPLPGIAAKIIAKRCAYYTLDDLEGKAPEPIEPTPPEPKTKAELLVDRVMSNLKEKFESFPVPHNPSEGHWKGLRQIAETFEGMSSGRLAVSGAEGKPLDLYLSYLPAGMGKTSTLIECVRLLTEDTQDIGVVIFLYRLAEIKKLVTEMNLKPEQFACLTSDPVTNALSPTRVDQAQILFTTQKRLEMRAIEGEQFKDMSGLFYRGKPRAVRVWDEAILPGLPLTVDRAGLLGLISAVNTFSPELFAILDAFAMSLHNSKDGDLVEVPDLERFDPRYGDLEAWRGQFELVHRDNAESFWRLSGSKARVRMDSKTKQTTLNHENILPHDLGPMLILDASGGLRATYRFWSKDRGNLIPLHSPVKYFSGLTCHLWNIGTGKDTMLKNKKHKQRVIAGIVEMIRSIPADKPVLMLHRKKGPRYWLDWEKELRDRLPGRDLSFCHWGQHTATNEFAHIKHVVITSLHLFNPAEYEAIARTAKDLALDIPLSPEDHRACVEGEIKHHLLQASNRGAIRYAVGEECLKDCHLFIAASTAKMTGFSVKLLEETFPKARIVPWQGKKEPEGKLKEALDTIQAIMLAGSDIATFVAVREAIGMSSANFNNKVVQHKDFPQMLAERGLAMVRQKGRGGSWFQRDEMLSLEPWAVGESLAA